MDLRNVHVYVLSQHLPKPISYYVEEKPSSQQNNKLNIITCYYQIIELLQCKKPTVTIQIVPSLTAVYLLIKNDIKETNLNIHTHKR